MRHLITPALIAATLLLAACSDPEPSEPVMKEKVGRDETQGIRRTESIGYSGDAIANKVDGLLNATDEQTTKIDQAVQSSE